MFHGIANILICVCVFYSDCYVFVVSVVFHIPAFQLFSSVQTPPKISVSCSEKLPGYNDDLMSPCSLFSSCLTPSCCANLSVFLVISWLMNSLFSHSLTDYNILRFIFQTLPLCKMRYLIFPHKTTCPLLAPYCLCGSARQMQSDGLQEEATVAGVLSHAITQPCDTSRNNLQGG